MKYHQVITPVPNGVVPPVYPTSGNILTWGVKGGISTTSTRLSTLMATRSILTIDVGMDARLSTPETKLSSLEDYLMASGVELEGQVFKSKHSNDTWLLTNAPSSKEFIYFANPYSLFNVRSVDFISTTEAITLKAHSHK